MTPLEDLLLTTRLPDATGSKRDRGSVMVLGGPAACPGAAILAGEAALRAGAGRVQLVVHPEVAALVAVAVPEAFVLGWDLAMALPAEVERRLGGADAVLIGPGCDEVAEEVVRAVAGAAAGTPVVLDAGALPAVAAVDPGSLVLAPNTLEAEQLLGTDGDERVLAKALAARFGRPAAVRGEVTALADADGRVWLADHAPDGLGTPGSGDVLVGVLVALLGLGAPPLAALAWAVHLHAGAGRSAAAVTPRGYLARDLVARLPEAISAPWRGLAAPAQGNATSVDADRTRR